MKASSEDGGIGAATIALPQASTSSPVLVVDSHTLPLDMCGAACARTNGRGLGIEVSYRASVAQRGRRPRHRGSRVCLDVKEGSGDGEGGGVGRLQCGAAWYKRQTTQAAVTWLRVRLSFCGAGCGGTNVGGKRRSLIGCASRWGWRRRRAWRRVALPAGAGRWAVLSARPPRDGTRLSPAADSRGTAAGAAVWDIRRGRRHKTGPLSKWTAGVGARVVGGV